MDYQHNNELRTALLNDDLAAMLVKNIIHNMDSEYFGKRRSERIVGGPKKLKELTENGAIRMVSKDNGRDYYNASDVLMRCRSCHSKS
jgi:hypothetical protein